MIIKNFAFSLVILLSLLTFSCAPKEDSRPAYKGWAIGRTTEIKDANGKVIPVAYLLDCRKVLENAENVHFYYSIITENPTSSTTSISNMIREEGLPKVTQFPKSMLKIDYYESSTTGNKQDFKGIFYESVEFKIVENSADGTRSAVATITPETENRIKEFHFNNPFFKDLKSGDVIINFTEKKDDLLSYQKINSSPREIPGLAIGSKVECR